MHATFTHRRRRALSHLLRALVLASTTFTIAIARADAPRDVVDEAQLTLNRALAGAQSWARWWPELLTRIALFDALNAIEPRYAPFSPGLATMPGASREAAAATAVYTLIGGAPEVDRGYLDARYRAQLSAVADAQARAAGVAIGRQAAHALLARRAADRFDRMEPAPHAAGPGLFELPPGAKVVASVRMAYTAPLVIPGVAMFDPGPPPAFASERARADRREVREIGAHASTRRSADQTAAAIYWNSSWLSFPTRALAQIAAERALAPLEHARFQALWAIAFFDAAVVDNTIKDKYRHWRPESAIRGSHADPAERDESWRPLVVTPTQPEWAAGGPMVAGVNATIFTAMAGGDAFRLRVTIPETSQTREWPSLAAMAREAAESRVWAGAHFRASVETGRAIGERVGAYVLANSLQPR